jgi:hypothetical protein
VSQAATALRNPELAGTAAPVVVGILTVVITT